MNNKISKDEIKKLIPHREPFLYVDECIQGTLKVMRSNYPNPLNIGSEESVSINDLVSIVSSVAGKNLQPYYVEGPQGVRGRRLAPVSSCRWIDVDVASRRARSTSSSSRTSTWTTAAPCPTSPRRPASEAASS